MRSATLKWIMLAGAVVISLIIAIQLYWLNHRYKLEQKQFDTNVIKSVRGLFEDIRLSDVPASHLQKMITRQPTKDSYIIKIANLPHQDTLVNYLTHELMAFDILTECDVALYDFKESRYVFQQSITFSSDNNNADPSSLKMYPASYHYLLLHFPDRSQYILSQMDLWIFGSIILALVLIGLAVSLFYFYKQKFLIEIQKDFVNNFTHEFKTPLAVMKIASEVLAQPGIVKQPERMEKYTSIISNETEHLQNQVERILKIAVSGQTALKIEKHLTPVRTLIDEAISKLQPLLERVNARVEVKMEAENIEVMADKIHLELAIVNLIENAIKYSQNPLIIIESGICGTERFIAIKDNGVGIDKKYFKYLFDKFYRVPTGDIHNVKGFGLGLNFVKKIVDAHKGRIIVNSVPGIGTEFKIILPV